MLRPPPRGGDHVVHHRKGSRLDHGCGEILRHRRCDVLRHGLDHRHHRGLDRRRNHLVHDGGHDTVDHPVHHGSDDTVAHLGHDPAHGTVAAQQVERRRTRGTEAESPRRAGAGEQTAQEPAARGGSPLHPLLLRRRHRLGSWPR
ncbi:hypothetical protein [Litorihabitans aurantiacus]|uniref:hypothetical protein n=1 Tax=Litorihabitans aurantiacus TaxID=1930061 RepID=UPI0024E13442|nr:hypothetical protein [Litorihabitans aurantiacus]